MLMIDIETLGTKFGSVVTQIGFCAFSWKGIEKSFSIRLDIQEQLDAGFKVDEDTIKFWLQQDPVAIAKVFLHPVAVGPFNIKSAHQVVKDACLEYGTDGVWGNGDLFDLGMLKTLFERSGLREPWHYRNPKDMRTMVAIANMTGWELEAARELFSKQAWFTAHDAESDARLQAMIVIDAHDALDSMLKKARS